MKISSKLKFSEFERSACDSIESFLKIFFFYSFTVSKWLSQMGIGSYVASIKPAITSVNKQAR